jgi:FKBP-type peptidyl-prolyl cis-trans isomerase SlyD
MRVVIGVLVAILCLAGAAQAQQQDKPPGPAIQDGATVRIEYTLKDENGQIVDTNKGLQPLTYRQGARQIIPGLERALKGMRAGEATKVTIKPEDGYGPVDPKAEIEVPKEAIPQGAKVGTRLEGRSPTGEPQIARVKEIKEKTVVLDINHPLAGQTLVFEIKVVGVDSPKP